KLEEIIAFLPDLIPALQEVSPLPLCFDHPSLAFHQTAIEAYNFEKSPPPLINSIAASRRELEELIALAGQYNASVLAIISERITASGGAPCETPEESYETAQYFVNLLQSKAGITNDQIFLDPGLPPVGADTQGLVNMGLDTIQLIRADKNLEGVHISVGLSNFAWGTPKTMRASMERAYLSIAGELGLDYSISNPEHHPQPLPIDDELVIGLKNALQQGRPLDGETIANAGFRQTTAILNLVKDDDDF
ncbi:MAG TPA: dihydropteroate synthase, partial [Flavobacteriia bacterium]|nr:dihydropteroate synthase [Flavobacteriia bacterium]